MNRLTEDGSQHRDTNNSLMKYHILLLINVRLEKIAYKWSHVNASMSTNHRFVLFFRDCIDVLLSNCSSIFSKEEQFVNSNHRYRRMHKRQDSI